MTATLHNLQDRNRLKLEREYVLAGRVAVAGGGGGPHYPDMEPRIAGLEVDMKEVKAGINRLEVAAATTYGRIDTLTERLHAHGETLSRVEKAIDGLGSKVDAKLISGPQMFTIFGGLMTLFIALAGGMITLLEHLGMLH